MGAPRSARIVRRRPVDKESDGPAAGATVEPIFSACFICGEDLKPFEPFQLALVLDADGNLRNVPYHQACELDTIATAMGDELEAMQKGGRAESIGERLRDLMEDLFERLDEAAER